MLVRYLVSKRPRGWCVSENGAVLAAGVDKPSAVQMAKLSAHAAGAVGAKAVLFVESDIGVIESVSLDQPQ